jgi:hypothetical protein
MRRILRAVALVGTAAAIVSTLALSGVASAATAAPVRPAAPAQPTASRQPDGCNNNNFCSYNAGNGGDLCFQTSSDRSEWPAACLDHNDGAYDRNGNSVNLYWGIGYSEAYYTLFSGNYLPYMSKNKFNHCVGGGTGCAGYNEAMQNQVASSAFNS